MRKLGLLIIAFFLAVGYSSAQSLKPDSPYPLKTGINQGTADSFVGTHYWYFYITPGTASVIVRFRTPKDVLGAQLNNNALTVTLSLDKTPWQVSKIVTANRNGSEAVFTTKKFDKKMKIIVSVAPPRQSLLRLGGDYEIEATGNVEFDELKNAVDPIVRTYAPKTSNKEDYGATKFLADGTIETANGFNGTWKVFDRENRIYSIVIDRNRYSLQYLPGFGLVEPDRPNMIRFQELRR